MGFLLGCVTQLSPLDEVRHELLVRNELQPGERERWQVVGVELVEKVSDVEKDLSLDFLGEAVAHIDSGQDVHQHPVEWLLVEIPLLCIVIALKLLLDVLKDLKHKLSFVEVESLE